jgi:PKD repeat protein
MAGTYTVNLTITGPGGSDSEVKTNYISVTGETAKISAQFKAFPQTGFGPLAVQFTDQSYGNVTSYAWDFNNDGRTDSTWQNPAHYFLSSGNFTVKLIVRGPEGTDEEVKYNFIQVLVKPKPPIAQFSRNPHSGSAPLTVQFTDRSKNNPDTYLWSFGDGGTSSEKNPLHTYHVPGTYKVKLITSNEAGSSSISGYVYVINSWNSSFT